MRDQTGRLLTGATALTVWSKQHARSVIVSSCVVALLILPAYAPSAGMLETAPLGPGTASEQSGAPDRPAKKPVKSAVIPPRGWFATKDFRDRRSGQPRRPAFKLISTRSDPLFRRDGVRSEDLGMASETVEMPVIAIFGNDSARLKPFVGASLALTQSYADDGHNRLLNITDPKAVIRFQGTAGLSLMSSGMSELQVFYRYIKFTDPSMRPSASLLALTDTLEAQQRQHEVMMGWRLKF